MVNRESGRVDDTSVRVFYELGRKDQISWRQHRDSLQSAIPNKRIMSMLRHNPPIIDLVIIELSLLHYKHLRNNLIRGKGEVNHSLHHRDLPLAVLRVDGRILDVLEVFPTLGIGHVQLLLQSVSAETDQVLDEGRFFGDEVLVERGEGGVFKEGVLGALLGVFLKGLGFGFRALRSFLGDCLSGIDLFFFKCLGYWSGRLIDDSLRNLLWLNFQSILFRVSDSILIFLKILVQTRKSGCECPES